MTCNLGVVSSNPTGGLKDLPILGGFHGEVPERSKGADCKSVGYAFEGPNPSLSKLALLIEGLFLMRVYVLF